ncbi:methyltransferase, putative, family protein [Nocardia brasiliensis ATCC 700358]|uniref:S-adenosyl-L-methionine-dependent methyltransferase n=1 Tax=Nocardia brasiliensis (strain ATCC 700358 / HUJEG-1) TaxID=1133849 RepID=K0F006_NOCB7|nr:methyltransferase, putative, family protein [Nocardia brasiliensis ATCC 700358]
MQYFHPAGTLAIVRTEGDTWDITTSVGSTALFVAAARALAGRRPDPLVVDPFAEIFTRAAGPEWADLLDGKAPDHPLLTPGFGPTFQTFLEARTKYFDDYFAAATAAGVRQVVILAAGLDARAYRLPWPDGTVVYELDQPRVLEFKRQTLAAHGDEPRAERREVPVDLREDWPKALRAKGFDPTAPTAWLAEGLLLYLPAAAVDQLFAHIAQLSAPGSRVAIEELDVVPEATRAALDRQPESPLNGGTDWVHLIYNERRSDAAQWFGARGWHTAGRTLPDYLAAVGREFDTAAPDAQVVPSLARLVTAIRP